MTVAQEVSRSKDKFSNSIHSQHRFATAFLVMKAFYKFRWSPVRHSELLDDVCLLRSFLARSNQLAFFMINFVSFQASPEAIQ